VPTDLTGFQRWVEDPRLPIALRDSKHFKPVETMGFTEMARKVLDEAKRLDF
jgi:hypothetical protein